MNTTQSSNYRNQNITDAREALRLARFYRLDGDASLALDLLHLARSHRRHAQSA
jgi:hypothetical protein